MVRVPLLLRRLSRGGSRGEFTGKLMPLEFWGPSLSSSVPLIQFSAQISPSQRGLWSHCPQPRESLYASSWCYGTSRLLEIIQSIRSFIHSLTPSLFVCSPSESPRAQGSGLATPRPFFTYPQPLTAGVWPMGVGRMSGRPRPPVTFSTPQICHLLPWNYDTS